MIIRCKFLSCSLGAPLISSRGMNEQNITLTEATEVSEFPAKMLQNKNVKLWR